MMLFFAILMVLVFIGFISQWKASDDVTISEPEKFREQIDPKISALISEIDGKYKIVHEYYIRVFIGDRIKDEEWMKANSGIGKEVPAWRLYKILNNPQTKEGMEFRNLMKNIFEARYLDVKKNKPNSYALTLTPTLIQQLSDINNDIDKLFPEAFLSIKREEKLKELGI